MPGDMTLLQEYAMMRDAEAFAELVRRYAGLVYGVCLRITGSTHDAEDVAQECFLKLAQSTGVVTSSLTGWLHALATSRATDAVRGAAARRRRERSAMAERVGQSEPTWEQASPHVDEALAELPEELCEVLVRHCLLGHNQTQVAKELGVTQATVSRRLSKGVEELRKALRKGGVVLPAALLTTLLVDNAALAAPATLVAELGKMAVAGVGRAAGAGAALESSAAPLAAIKTKLVAIAAAAGFVAAVGVLVYRLLPQGEPPQALVAAAVSPKEEPQAPAPPAGVDPGEAQDVEPFIRWQYHIGDSVRGHSMEGETLYFKDHSRSSVHAVDTRTGRAIWVRKIDFPFVKGGVREVGDSVYVLTRDHLLSLDRATGATRADVPYKTEFSDRVKWNCSHTLYIDSEERGAVAFCGPWADHGLDLECDVEVVYFNLKTGLSSMRRMTGRWGNFVGGPYEDVVWFTTGLERTGLDTSQLHAIRLSDGGTTSLPRDAPQWGMSRQELWAACTEIYHYNWQFYLGECRADGRVYQEKDGFGTMPFVVPSKTHCPEGFVYLWKNRNTLEKRTEEGELVWAHASPEHLPGFIGVSPGGPVIGGARSVVYCLSERPAQADERPTEAF